MDKNLLQPAAPDLTTALIVEDNPQFARLITEAIRSLGELWESRTYHTGQEALADLAQGVARANLVLVDLGLPDISGLEVIREIHQRFPDIPVLVVSVLGSAESVLQAVKLGARGYLQKGDSSLTLAEGIREVLAGHYPISPSLAHHLFQLVHSPVQPLDSSGDPLAAREIELLGLLGQGYTYDEAAKQMGITFATAQTYSKRIHQKLQVSSKGQALAAARQRGILP